MEPTTPSPEPVEESIFTESDYSMEGYDKHIRRARVLLFVMAGLTLLSLFWIGPIDNLQNYITAGVLVVIAGVFAGLAIWTKKKPYTALLTALILYICLIVLAAIGDPKTLIQGWIWKIVIIVLLVLGLQNARDAQSLMKAFGKDE